MSQSIVFLTHLGLTVDNVQLFTNDCVWRKLVNLFSIQGLLCGAQLKMARRLVAIEGRKYLWRSNMPVFVWKRSTFYTIRFTVQFLQAYITIGYSDHVNVRLNIPWTNNTFLEIHMTLLTIAWSLKFSLAGRVADTTICGYIRHWHATINLTKIFIRPT